MPLHNQNNVLSLVLSFLQVPLGVILKNKNTLDDTMDILDGLHKYVSSIRKLQQFEDPGGPGRETEVTEIERDHFLPHTDSSVSGHKNYSIEVLHLIASYFLPPVYATQILWGQFVRNHKKTGCNIYAAPHMEHLNRLCKDAISHMVQTKTPSAIARVGKALGPLAELTVNALTIRHVRLFFDPPRGVSDY